MSRITHIIYLAIIAILVIALVLPRGDNDDSGSIDTDVGRFEPKIAILQFVSLEATEQTASTAATLTADLAQRLISLSSVSVVPGRDTRSLVGQDLTIGEIGNRLSASMVLEGAVRETSDRIRVTVQLIDVDTEEHLWSNTYDRQPDDLEGVVADISRSVTGRISY